MVGLPFLAVEVAPVLDPMYCLQQNEHFVVETMMGQAGSTLQNCRLILHAREMVANDSVQCLIHRSH